MYTEPLVTKVLHFAHTSKCFEDLHVVRNGLLAELPGDDAFDKDVSPVHYTIIPYRFFAKICRSS